MRWFSSDVSLCQPLLSSGRHFSLSLRTLHKLWSASSFGFGNQLPNPVRV
jgi:hypothetical protein